VAVATSSSKVLNNVEAVRDTLYEALKNDDKVVILGEDVGNRGNVFLITKDFIKEFGTERIIAGQLLATALVIDRDGTRRGFDIPLTRAIADSVVEASEMKYGAPVRTEGYNDGNWILVDYGSVIVHVFTPAAREFYNLERLWAKPTSSRKRKK